MERKYTNRYRSFCDCLKGLEEARMRDPDDDFVLSGTIQKFSLTFDISWKVMKDILVKYYKIQDFAAGSPRDTLRASYSVGLIGDDEWMQMLDMRNALAHDYDGSLAKSCFMTILNEYIPLFEKFRVRAAESLQDM